MTADTLPAREAATEPPKYQAYARRVLANAIATVQRNSTVCLSHDDVFALWGLRLIQDGERPEGAP